MSWNMEVLYKSGPPSSHSSGPCLYSSTCEFSAFGGVLEEAHSRARCLSN